MHSPINPAAKKTVVFGSELSWDDLWKNKLIPNVFENSYDSIRSYLWLTRNTESPRQFHLWSLLSLVSAVTATNTYFARGITGKLRLNQGIVLIGRGAIRKSSALNFMKRFADEISLNIGPTDTGGARQGIMRAMQPLWQDDVRDAQPELDFPLTLENLANSTFDNVIAKTNNRHTHPSALFFISPELGRILSCQTRELLDFFNDGLDAETIDYKTKTTQIRIASPMINLLSATTPDNLFSMLPRDAYTHGMLSRLIFVYAPHAEASIPIPPEQSIEEASLQSMLLDRLHRITREAKGPLKMTPAAEREYRLLYEWKVATLEFKLNAYAGRRGDHLARLASVICLLRAESPFVINHRDVAMAHVILALTEADMDGAYLGFDKTIEGRAYAFVREIIENEPNHVHERGDLYAMMSRGGFDDDTTTRVFERLINARRLRASEDGKKIFLGRSPGREKIAAYLNGFLGRN